MADTGWFLENGQWFFLDEDGQTYPVSAYGEYGGHGTRLPNEVEPQPNTPTEPRQERPEQPQQPQPEASGGTWLAASGIGLLAGAVAILLWPKKRRR